MSFRDAAPLWAVLAGLGALAWLVTIAQADTMDAGPGTMGMTFALFLGSWVVMMAAMMLPAIGPMAAAEVDTLASTRAGRVVGTVAFGAGFLVPWAAYGAVAFLALEGAERIVASSPDGARWLGAAIFAVAGLYQFSPWKLRALHHCRSAMASEADRSSGWMAGLRDGIVCVGCCWALMTVLIPVGVMNITGMVVLAVAIFAEKVLPRPRLVAALVGAAFLVLAVVALADPTMFPGLVPAEAGMDMGGMDSGGMEMGGMDMGGS
jgi:predicted metal-binding membrane protein